MAARREFSSPAVHVRQTGDEKRIESGTLRSGGGCVDGYEGGEGKLWDEEDEL